MTAAQTPSPTASEAEIQKLLRDEIAALRQALGQRLTEIEGLAGRLGQATAAAGAAASGEQLTMLKRRHQLEITLLHALYASWQRGPAPGVASFADQLALIEGSDLFDAGWYGATYPDVAGSGLAPYEHYLRSGAFEGRDPGPRFDTMAYYLANPDVAAAGWPALVHYVGYGRAEGRRPG